jgi:hypothetical protein
MKRIIEKLYKLLKLPNLGGKQLQIKTIEENKDMGFSPIGRSRLHTLHKSNDDHDLLHKDIYRADLDQIYTSINTLFHITLKFSDKLIKDMISGLGELAVSNVEEFSTPTSSIKSKTNIKSSSSNKNLFSLRKMTEIVLVNIHRIEQIWQIIVDQLLVISM